MAANVRARASLVALLVALACHARAETPGWLRYPNGDQISGVLIEGDARSGHFKSPRFGSIFFKEGEARFEPTPAPAREGPSAAQEQRPLDPAPSTSWQPSAWSLGVSGYWKRDGGDVSKDIALDLDSTWRHPTDEFKLSLSTDYKKVGSAVDNNEQTGSLRWLRDLKSPWFLLGTLKAKRSVFTVDPNPALDYLLLQGTLGAGMRLPWAERGSSLIALGRESVSVSLITLDRRLFTGATSLLVENKILLQPRVTFANTLYLYRWRDGSSGVDSLADLSYQLSERLSIGLRHEYRRNAVNLDLGSFNRLSVTTRIGL